MKAKIKLIQENFKKNEHAFFKNRNGSVIWLFDIGFEGNPKVFRFGSMKKEPRFEIGDEVDYQIIKDDYVSVKKTDNVFNTKSRTLVNNNAEIAIAATTKAIDLLMIVKPIDFKVLDDTKTHFGKNTLKRASSLIADVIKDVQSMLDIK